VGGPDLLTIDGHQAQVVASGEDVDIDLAIAKVNQRLKGVPLILQSSGTEGALVKIAGFEHVVGREYAIRQIRGELGRQVGLESRSRNGRLDAWDIRVVDDFMLRPGQSGSPIIDDHNGAVVGILKIRQGDGERGLAISTKVVQDLWPNLTSLLLEETHQDRQYVDWGNAPDVSALFGRGEELAILRRWLLEDRCRVVSIVGLRGIGKTAVTVGLAKGIAGKSDLPSSLMRGVQDEFELVIWKSLLNAPPVSEVLRDIIAFVSNQEEVSLPTSIEEQVSRLTYYIKKHRCLLILDNVETVLRSGVDEAGAYRDGYDGYGELIRRFGSSTHQSCLVLNSREKPGDVAIMEGRSRPVRTLKIDGLKDDSGKRVLDEIGNFSGTEADWAELISLYGGNPLALELAAKHIGEVFFGDISRFLASGKPVFDDLQGLLDWHLNRLSAPEMEAICWLAIDREPVTLLELESSVLTPNSKKQLPSTLQSLQRRIPLERASSRFSLQPVLIEHVTNRIIITAMNDLLTGRAGILETHSLQRALARDYIREAQSRLIVSPIVSSLENALGGPGRAQSHLREYIHTLRGMGHRRPSYAGGNTINLLSHLDTVLNDYDFSNLDIRQAYLQEVRLHNVNLAHARFEDSVFTQTFGPISCLAVSADGELVAASEYNGDIHIWRLADFQMVATLRGHINWIFALAFSPDGITLASGGEDKVVRLWNLETGECIAELKEHSNSVWAVAFSPNGKMLATGSEDQSIKVWNVRSGTCIASMADHQQKVFCLEFSPDGQKLASASADHTVKVWDIFDWGSPHTFEGHGDTVRGVSFSPDSQVIASCSWDRTIKLWNSENGECINTLRGHTDSIHSVAFHPSGQAIASSGESGAIRIWSVGEGKCVTALQRHAGEVWKVAFSLDGQVLVSGGYDGTIRIWDTRDWVCRNTIHGYIDWVQALAFHPAGNTIAGSNGDLTIKVWDVESGVCRAVLEAHTGWTFSVTFSPDGSTMATGSDDRSIKIWDAETWKVVRTLEGHSKWVQALAFSGDGTTLASGSDDRTVKLWDLSAGECVRTLSGHTEGVWSLAFAPQSRLLASGSEDHTIKVWDVDKGKCVQTLVGHEDRVNGVAFHPGGDRLVSCSDDKTVRVWDISSGVCTQILSGHEGWVISVVYDASGRYIWSGGKDGSLRVWDGSTGECVGTLSGHTGGIWSIDYNKERDLIATASEDGAIRVWKGQTQSCEQILRPPKPYEGTNILGVSGLTGAQLTSLRALGAVETQESLEASHSDQLASSATHDYVKYAGDYATLGFDGTYYLGFRDIPALLAKHVTGRKALDYGCGAGRSTRFLKGLGFEAVGVDISMDMLSKAVRQDESGAYHHISSGRLPFNAATFDLVFSSFVFIEVPTLGDISFILRDIKRVLKADGRFVLLTGPIDRIKGNWVSFSYDFPENDKVFSSGDTVKLQIRGTPVVLYDYYWPDEDLRRVFGDIGFKLFEMHKPLGREDDPIEWLDETRYAYAGIYVVGIA
jgi:WD40 repeat protein/SAM-dependent methyltransferase